MPDGKTIDFSQQPSSRVTVLDKGSLHRVLNAPQLYAIGYGDVGSSIYYALGVTTLYALGATPLALALAGLVFFCTVLTYAELSAAMPEAGGSCSFARHAFNDLISFVAGWALLLDYIVTIAISAYTVGPYLKHFFPVLTSAGGNVPFALGIIGILLVLNLVGIRQSTWVSLFLCVFNNITQLIIIGIAVVLLLELFNPAAFVANIHQLILHMQIGLPEASWSPTWPDFMKGVGMAMVAYIGIESISQLAGEARHPDKTIPKAMLATMVTLFVFYFAISLVALSAVTPQELSSAYLEDPLAGIVAALPVGREILKPWIGILGATILFIAANAGLVGASRLTFSMGEYFELPRFFYRLHPRFKTPYMSLMVFSGLAGIVILFGKHLRNLADLYNFGAMLSFALAHLSLLGLRFRRPDLKRPFRALFNVKLGRYVIPLTAVLGLLGTSAVWVDVVLTKPAGRDFGFVWLGVGLVSYFWYRAKQKLPPAARLEIEKLTVPGYKEVSIRKILVPAIGASVNETIQFAARLAKLHGAELSALHIIEIPSSLPLDTFFPEKLALADSILEQAQAVGREYEVPIEAQIKQARFAGETIIELAKDGAYDLIILSDKPRPLAAAPGRTTFGTTVEYVMKSAPCRVWLFTGKG